MGSSVSSGCSSSLGEDDTNEAQTPQWRRPSACHIAAPVFDAPAANYFDYKVVKIDLYACWLLPGYMHCVWEVPMTMITYPTIGRTLEHVFIKLTTADGSLFVVQFGADGYSIIKCATEKVAMAYGQGPHGEPWLRRSKHVYFSFVDVFEFCRKWDPYYGIFNNCQDFAEQLWDRYPEGKPYEGEPEDERLEDTNAFIRGAMNEKASGMQLHTEQLATEAQDHGTPQPSNAPLPGLSLNTARLDERRVACSPDESCEEQ